MPVINNGKSINEQATFPATEKHISLSLTSIRGPIFSGSLPVGTLAKVLSPGKRLRTKGRDPREGFNSLFRVDGY